MKRTILLVFCLAAASCLMVSPAPAHYVYLQPDGSISATTGDALTVYAYLYAETVDIIYGWAFTQVFDTAELERTSVNNTSTLGALGSSQHQIAGSDFTSLARYDYSFTGLPLEESTSYELFSVTYSFKSGAIDGYSDIWLDWTKGSIDVYYWDFESIDPDVFPTYLPRNEGTGPDYGSNAVPIPGAVWLFGSGLLALVGLKRRIPL